jgi:predicted alpha/beta hydrolase family esterase
MRKRNQIFIIHGGMTFRNRRDYLHYLRTRDVSVEGKKSWAGSYLDEKLGRGFEIIRPRMPLADDAKYEDWKIVLERYFPYLRNGLVLIGVSLGGIFLAKYLSEHKFPKKISSVYLVCPPFDNTLGGEDLLGGFKLKDDLSLIEKNAKNVYLLFSRDDKCVPVAHAEKYSRKLKAAKILIYKSKNGHFQISRFPEIIKMIKGDFKAK